MLYNQTSYNQLNGRGRTLRRSYSLYRKEPRPKYFFKKPIKEILNKLIHCMANQRSSNISFMETRILT